MANRSNLEVVLEFLGRPLVWLTMCTAALVYVIGAGVVDMKLLRDVLNLVSDTIAKINPW